MHKKYTKRKKCWKEKKRKKNENQTWDQGNCDTIKEW